MLINYLKIVFRNLTRYKSYTAINILGMAVGIAAIVWGFQTYRYSFSFDNFHKDRDNVYRALSFQSGANGARGIFPMAAVKQAQAIPAGLGCGIAPIAGTASDHQIARAVVFMQG